MIYSDSTFYLSVLMFIVGVAVLVQIGRWYYQWKSPIARIMSNDEARSEFGELMSARLGVAMRAAELDAVIIDKWEQWPLEYRPALYQVLRHTQLLEETLIEEAMENGIYPKRIVTQGPIIASPPQSLTLPPDPEAQKPMSHVRAVSRVVTLPSARWINGQLVRTA